MLWVGSYAENGGRGLYPLYRTLSTGWRASDPFESARNASFGVRSERHGLLYLLDEQGGTLGIYRHENGWTEIARLSTEGAEPCYVTLDAAETRLAVANYASGNIALYSLDAATGVPLGNPVVRWATGSGPNPERQKGPHAHCVRFSPDSRQLYHVDLGIDQILAYALEESLGEARLAYGAPSGSGPRHLVFHPARARAFLISELESTVTVLETADTSFRAVGHVSTLPPDFRGESLGGHIGMNASGDRLYVTNRGHDSIATFAVEGDRLSLLEHVPSGGASPRFFLLLETEKRMLVANEEGGNVTAFGIRSDGTLEPEGVCATVPGAVFLFGA
jgi:6-phosphogluconolactonase